MEQIEDSFTIICNRCKEQVTFYLGDETESDTINITPVAYDVDLMDVAIDCSCGNTTY